MFWHEDIQMNFSSSSCLIFFVYQKSVKDVDELKLRLTEAWSGIHQSIIDQAIDQWRDRLNVDANRKHFEHMLLPVASQLSKNCCSFETYISVLLQNFTEVLTF